MLIKPNPRIGIFGCGAVAESGHLPALRSLGLEPAVLFDPSRSRAGAAAAKWGGEPVTSLSDAVAGCDAAIVAAPHAAHHELCEVLLEAGRPVLVEKPLAATDVEAQALVTLAASSETTLHVAQMRRFLLINQWVKALIADEPLGPLRTISLREGALDQWDAATDTHLNRDSSGGGVLLGIGVHSLDILGWWLGDLSLVSYADDAAGGVEANAEIRLASETVGVDVELSRVRSLPNTARLTFDRGEVIVDLHANDVISAASLPRGRRGPRAPQGFVELFADQLSGWLGLRSEHGGILPEAAESARIIALITACYQRTSRIVYPWDRLVGG